MPLLSGWLHRRRAAASPWHSLAPIREELFSVERLEQHAVSLAAAQRVSASPPRVFSLQRRLQGNTAALLDAYQTSAKALADGRDIMPAAAWLLDNYHLVEAQIKEVRADLPPGYYRQLPKLADGPFAGYPRVLGLAWAFVAHTDSYFDPDVLQSFLAAYQRVQPLTIGELWAVAITLRMVLIENLRRLADQITEEQGARIEADELARRLLVPDGDRSVPVLDELSRDQQGLSEAFAAQLAKRLRDQDPRTMPVLGWLEHQLARQGDSIDEVVHRVQQRQGAANVTMRNIINSMRLVSSIDWPDMVERASLVDARLGAASGFAAMDFPTRNRYRNAIERLARGATCAELDVVEHALAAAQQARASEAEFIEAARVGDPGYHLIGAGRRALENAIGYRPTLGRRLGRGVRGLGITGYLGAIGVFTMGLLGLALWALTAVMPNGWSSDGAGLLVALALVGWLPASDVATALVNLAITRRVGPLSLPSLDLAAGVPASMRTLVVVPTLLTSEAELDDQIERLEVHHLASGEGALLYALLVDGVDAEQQVLASDAPLLAAARRSIQRLNQRHGGVKGESSERFMLLYRGRAFNAVEKCWMGWERKRGKLHELNRWLRGATDTAFIDAPAAPANVRYVITLDADTRLPREAAIRLIGKMAHPLNRPRFSETDRRVVEGYGVLQPRSSPALPVGAEGSRFQRLFSAPGGIDPYAGAVSDVYQDLFGEGSFAGKGIYDIDAFMAAMEGRVQDNTLLSHDLFEGLFVRAGLVSDVEVVEDFPARYDVAAKRQHRWTRGDWQLLPWIVGMAHSGISARAQRLSLLARWKMLDNLRRSLLIPATLASLALCWWLPLPAAALGTLLLVGVIAVPPLLPLLAAIVPARPGLELRPHVARLRLLSRIALMQTLMLLAFLPDQAGRMLDAIGRTLFRLGVSRRHLLEWTTAAQSALSPHLTPRGFYRAMALGLAAGLVVAAAAVLHDPRVGPVVVPIALLWLCAPALAAYLSRAPVETPRRPLKPQERIELRLIARRTWRFFETFVTPLENDLPPDNFQEDPQPVVAPRTSPTNLGLYLLSTVAARDFGWAGTLATLERLERTLATMRRLPRYNGHFYNWYATRDLRPLEPIYISSVDSGNLAGHLIALANACETWLPARALADLRPGLGDTLHLAQEALGRLDLPEDQRQGLTAQGEAIAALLMASPTELALPRLTLLSETLARAVRDRLTPGVSEPADEALFWVAALERMLGEHVQDTERLGAPAIASRLQALATEARQMAMAMDFTFLLNDERRLLSIGYAVVQNRLDESCYDLLASEARLASLFAIAKGDVPTRHWFRLGRTATPLGGASALISWSGSMFEYLMPSLLMRAPDGSLLAQTNRRVVKRQRAYGQSLGVPWGLSESAYNARDLEFTYQYSNFGVPGLGLKRWLSADVVIAPYATGLAAMVDPLAAHQNFARLKAMGALGRYGFYEALDFTRTRLPVGEQVAIVRSFMAHHQGMTIVSLANAEHQGLMRARFHREPMIKACELLLQERVPHDIAIAYPRAEEVKAAPQTLPGEAPTVRRFTMANAAPPVTHLLSNGHYAVMLTAGGGGYSRWQSVAVTRWRSDATCDAWGSFIFLRDLQDEVAWSATGPLASTPDASQKDRQEVVFAEDHASYSRRHGPLSSLLEVLVSGEDNGEVRRVSLTNTGRSARDIEVTSYAELVLTTPATDNAHPAFAKLFVVTEYLPELGALIATRRPRTPDEPPVWAAHFAVVEGHVLGELEYETDRARFIGRGRSLPTAASLAKGQALSNTVGTVLDPVFSLRCRVRVPPGSGVRVAFWTVVAASRQALVDLIDKHHDRSAFDRAQTLAWTQAQVQLRHLGIKTDEAADFQRLAAPLLYPDARFRAPAEAILRGAGPQSGLWPHAISGDLPIVLLRIDSLDDLALVRQLLRAHEYWRMKRLGVDVVIVNERASSYVQDLQNAIETAVLSSQARPRLRDGFVQGTVTTLRADLMSQASQALLRSVAHVVLQAHRGPLSSQLEHIEPAGKPAERAPDKILPSPRKEWVDSVKHADVPALEFFNGLGGFDRHGREYVTVLTQGHTTPAPWINVMANAGFGYQVSAEGSGYLWAENSRDNQLTPWSNDPVTDAPGEAFYLRDEQGGALWTPTALPIRDAGRYLARHGFGYSRFEHQAHGIATDLLHFVVLDAPVRVSRMTLENRSGRVRRVSVTAYLEWVLGTSRSESAPFIVTEMDETSGAMLARRPWSIGFSERIAFTDLGGQQSAWTADRREFLGERGTLGAPAALTGDTPLSGACGAGLDPCSALQCEVEIAPGARVEVIALVGQGRSLDEVRSLIARYRAADLDAELAAVEAHWQARLNAVQVKTPDRAMDIMLNGWLLYQTLACRITARSAFYQASGAYGFRDQLQDGMALSFACPAITRAHLLTAASRQFVEGDVQHWWLPQEGQGVRTRISDDRVWLAYACALYIETSGEASILEQRVSFLEGPALKDDEHDAFFQPETAVETGTLFEHCARGLDQSLALTGENDLPLIGGGDWNDGMNRVGVAGKGESVWLGWLLLRTLGLFAPYAERYDPPRAERWRAHAKGLREALDSVAWDGQWYRRACFDDGSWLGAEGAEECRIDAIAQTWAVLSGGADPEKAACAMRSFKRELVRDERGMALLFWPPFDKIPKDPGYIRGYPPGLRENGGQYSHAAMWGILAFTELDEADEAVSLFGLLNPINHARTPDATQRYKVEPYVVAADVYSVAPHEGRGGWTWYTGSAAWMYRAGIEGILGLRRRGQTLVIAPCLPTSWWGFEVQVCVDATRYAIRVDQVTEEASDRAVLDDSALPDVDGPLILPLDGGDHRLTLTLAQGDAGLDGGKKGLSRI
ncbi:GH36-type glycosyl hydrolase domain-containing protein [Halomonas sp. GD1P12]|uniref:GH36-type glycosyl hydrolase domain-containing protein n=1 Tax=Halomonas sp. GD1P12 TaxID=2982691 RepID=UPI0021E410E1|nr:glucoamylase family protein [Halomonas sp. GD1P12]UYF99008.1 glycosyl transferase [Halomonas sp. GD1P12]